MLKVFYKSERVVGYEVLQGCVLNGMEAFLLFVSIQRFVFCNLSSPVLQKMLSRCLWVGSE